MTEVLEAFTNERLLTLTADGVAISHEVVLAAWPLLRDTWLAGTQEDRIVRSRLHHTTAEWARYSRDPSYLYGGSLLKAATGMAARISADPAPYPPLSQAERDFLNASDRARRHRRRRRRAFAALLGAVVIAVGAVAVLAVQVIHEATRPPAVAISQQLIGMSHFNAAYPALASMLSVEAWQFDHSRAARNAMLAAAERRITLLHRTEPLAISPGGTLLASDDSGSRIWLWNVANSQPDGQPFTGDAGPIVSVAFRPYSSMLATGDSIGTVRLWDAGTNQAIGRPLTGHRGPVDSVAFNPRGNVLAASGQDGTVRFWSAASRQPTGRVIVGHHGPILSVAYSPHGNTLATGSADGAVQLWNAATHRQAAVLKGHTGAAYSVAFSPHGNTLAASGQDGKVLFWNAAGQRDGPPIIGHHGRILSVAYSPHGNILATGSQDGAVQLWDATTHRQAAVLKGHTGAVYSVAFAPDGMLATAGSADHTVLLWDVAVIGPLEHTPADSSGPYLVHYLCATVRAELARGLGAIRAPDLPNGLSMTL